jgi:hypothetical protein
MALLIFSSFQQQALALAFGFGFDRILDTTSKLTATGK